MLAPGPGAGGCYGGDVLHHWWWLHWPRKNRQPAAKSRHLLAMCPTCDHQAKVPCRMGTACSQGEVLCEERYLDWGGQPWHQQHEMPLLQRTTQHSAARTPSPTPAYGVLQQLVVQRTAVK